MRRCGQSAGVRIVVRECPLRHASITFQGQPTSHMCVARVSNRAQMRFENYGYLFQTFVFKI